MALIDISRPLFAGMPHWPEDYGVHFKLDASIADGSPCNVGRLSMSVHSATHADAPFHYNNEAQKIDELPPQLFVGPARVVDARGPQTLTRELFAGIDLSATPRVLFRTDTWTDPTIFPETWPLLDETLPAWLASCGVQLVGMDVPSVDLIGNLDLTLHHALERAGIVIIESLDLRNVDAGVYEFIGLPLKLRGGDGSPIRAVLRK